MLIERDAGYLRHFGESDGGLREYKNVKAACGKIVHMASTVKPEPELTAKYERRYQQFKRIYPACKELFADFAKE